MSPSIPRTMKAAVIDRFGGPWVLCITKIPVPEVDAHEVLIRVRTAGIGVWDPWLRGGGSGIHSFPQVLGTDGVSTGSSPRGLSASRSAASTGSRMSRRRIGT